MPVAYSFSIDDFFGGVFQGFKVFTGLAGGGSSCNIAWCQASCGASEIEMSELSCVAPNVCCRPENVCGDTYIDSGEDCEGLNLNGEDCESQGFDGGDLACSSCSFNTDDCYSCGDGTCDAAETCAGCVEDCDGETADCTGGQVCELGECVSPAPATCTGGIALTTCTDSPPEYCDVAGDLVNNCNECGCSNSETCNSETGNCYIPIVSSGSGSYSGRTYNANDLVVSNQNSLDEEKSSSQSSGSNNLYDIGELRVKDKIKVTVKNDEHTVEINNIYTDTKLSKKTVKVIISSDPIEVLLYEDVPREVDVDGDGIFDLKLTATNVQGSYSFDLEIEELEESVIIRAENLETEPQKSPFDEVINPLTAPINVGVGGFMIFNLVIMLLLVFFFYSIGKGVKSAFKR